MRKAALDRLAAGNATVEGLAAEFGVNASRIEAWRLQATAKMGPSTGASGLAGAFGASAPAAPAKEKEREIDAEELMALIRTVDSVLMKGVAGTRAKDVPLAKQVALMEIPSDDLKSMTTLAPYAAKYAPTVFKHFDKLMAGAFIGVWAMSVVTRLKYLHAEQLQVLRENPALARGVTLPVEPNGKVKK